MTVAARGRPVGLVRSAAILSLSLVLALAARPVLAQPTSDAERRFFAIYKELVEIDTTDSAGDTTRAAQAMAAHLRAAGFPESDLRIIVPPGAPKKGNLVARLRGTGAKRPLLLLAHIDVVEAKREDWQREPFRLVEENGYYYARGASDNKAMAAIFVANLMAMREAGVRPARDIVLALTADEEIIPSPHNGVELLLREHRALVDAELALNEGGSGIRDASGRYVMNTIQAGEKVFQTYRIETTHAGGHSARPQPENAIYRLSEALAKLSKHVFPVQLNEVTRAYFDRMSKLESGATAADMRAILATPPDAQAAARLSANPGINNLLRTTCVATMVQAGHATNALPQRATATVNCRVLPGESVDAVRETLVRVIADEKVTVTPTHAPVLSPPAPLSPLIMQPVERITAAMWPGVPVIPTMVAGATDGRFLANAGIPTYGVSGIFRDRDGGGVHGLNERLPVKSLYEGRVFLDRLVRALVE
jgi:acetylornithine deacetylase/succinyl-diaminopimelate desuccinylase-like protein